MRPRLYYGYCKALSWLPNVEQELTALLIRELFVVLENINECDVAIESFQCLSALLDQQLSFHTRANVLRRWVSLIY